MSQTVSKRKRFQRLLHEEDHDPISGVSNLFDVAMVFAVALLVALFTQVPGSKALVNQHASPAESKAARDQPGAIPKAGDRLERFQVGDREVGGQGVRLGIAYRLPTGEVIYVPEQTANP